MTDPKLNELPADPAGEFADSPDKGVTEAQAVRPGKAREGLSIRDTIAGDTALSVGARGVDTSGVEAGAGAGSGLTYTTPGDSGTPAPEIVPGARGSGTTLRSDSLSSQTPTTRVDGPTNVDAPTNEEIAQRAHRLWMERGCPHGSAEIDWERAREELSAERQRAQASAAGV